MQLDKNTSVYLGEGHIYSDSTGKQYVSVSDLVRKVEPEFDRQQVSYYTARKRVMGRMGILDAKKVPEPEIKAEQAMVLQEWGAMAGEASEHGNVIHKALEDWRKGNATDVRFEGLCKQVDHVLAGYYRVYEEFLLADEEYLLAGIPDLVCQRQKENSLIDIKDYKTNLRRGMTFDSTYVKDGRRVHTNKMFAPPIAHLEYSNYNLYALKMSCYGIMLERRYKMHIGNLEVIYIKAEYGQDNELWVRSVELYPMTYLRSDAQAVIDAFKPQIAW